MSINQKLASRENNFTFIRLFAASLVLFSHSYPLTGNTGEFFARYWGVDTGGGIGVAIFFILSGFLVTRSLLHSNSPFRYICSRFLRIFPAMVGVTLITIICVGPLFTDLSIRDYLGHEATLSYLKNIKLFPLQHTLPGVFNNNPTPVVNGSLWTLPVEVTMYALLLLFFITIKITRRTSLVVCAMFFVFYYLFSYRYHLNWNQQGGIVLPGVGFFNFLKLGSLFFLGSVTYLYREIIPLKIGYFLITLILFMLASHTGPLSFAIFAATSTYIIMYLAFMPIDLNPLTRRLGDISYGMYIYAFPVQQAVIHKFGNSLSPALVTVIALAFTTVFAYLSWHFLEKKVLRLKLVFPKLEQPDSPCPKKTRYKK